ncbi:proline dehydrogenase family protein [Dactylosporangium maewongense]|uniref:proline dehydrogenase n=1 Tax=Dactylosporangium maewongense TaxID=634393 RepID=A0ABN1ZPX0_9ACTN
MPNQLLLAASRSPRTRTAVSRFRLTRRLVDRFVAGEGEQQVVPVADRLVRAGLTVTVDHLGEDTRTAQQARATRDAYTALLAALHGAGLAAAAEVSVKLSALGAAVPGDGSRYADEYAHDVCAAAAAAGTTVTFDMEDHTTVDTTLSLVGRLRLQFPWVGVAVQTYLRRTAADCKDLAYPGSRVRLVKGAYAEPASVLVRNAREVDAAYRACLETLLRAGAYPMVATHDPALIAHASALTGELSVPSDGYEFQMLYGVRSQEQLRLAQAGNRMRVYLPYGDDWYGYFMRRLAERPANLLLLTRSLLPGAHR